MALHEEHEELSQRLWHTHLAKERKNLSASVEETLADSSIDDDLWLDEIAEPDNIVQDVKKKNTVIPPRLSLQSKVMPAIKAEGDKAAAIPIHRVPEINGVVGQQSAPETNNGNLLVRFARRFTSQFSMISSPKQAGTSSLVPMPPNDVSHNFVSKEGSVSHQTGVHPPFEQREVMRATIVDAVPTSKALAASSPTKQRLAGYTAKIKLQTVELPVAVEKPRSILEERQDTAALESREVLGELEQTLSRDKAKDENAPGFSGIDVLREESLTTSTHLPAIGVSRNRESAVMRGTLAGSDVFESGQRDVMVENKHVTAQSVVIVTLTANPGPVVVQYISLQPREGFTVHLTAPTTAKIPFNYVILLGELF